MGSCSSRPDDGLSEYQQDVEAPMWLLKVEDVLRMTPRLLPHQVLKSQRLLVKWSPKMFAIFVSHQWLGFKHPDPNGEQLQVLQGILSNLIARKLKLGEDCTSQFMKGVLSEKEFNWIASAYIWLDYFSVPQKLDGYLRGHGLAEEQSLYVYSIPGYVQRCNMFVALTPQSTHCDKGTECNFYSWLGRGWCRTELWCHFLSSKMPIVVAKGPLLAELSSPVWHRYPVYSGEFSEKLDRESCSSIIEKAFRHHISQLKKKLNLTSYRLYLSIFEDMTGKAARTRSVEDFLKEFVFSKVSQGGSLSPVACATLTGDSELVRSLVRQKASMHSRAPLLPEVNNATDCAPLHLAVWFKSNNLEILETLLQLGADPNDTTSNVAPPLAYCRSAEAVRLLVQYKADVNCPGGHISRFLPLQGVASLYAPCEVLQALLDLRANVHGGSRGFASMSPLHPLTQNTVRADPSNDLKSAQLLLENRADVNQVLHPEGAMRSIELMSRAYCRVHWGKPSLAMRLMRDGSTTPLGWSAIFGNEHMLTFLLRARADPDIPNNRGLRPIDMAPESSRIREILQNPSEHIYSMEYDSELVTETF